MKNSLFPLIFLIVLLSGCSSLPNENPSAQMLSTEIAKTQIVLDQASTFVAQTVTAIPSSTATLFPTETPLPTFTLTPTRMPGVEAKTNINANCRSGPDSRFQLIDVAPSGSVVSLTGSVLVDARWWRVTLDNGIECWLKENTIDLMNDVSSLPTLESPPTPTPFPPEIWAGDWVVSLPQWISPSSPNGIQKQALFVVTKNILSTTFGTANDTRISLSGTINPDGYIIGTLSFGSPDKSTMQLRFANGNQNQFVGYYKFEWNSQVNIREICGARVGTPLPNPCGLN